MVFKKYFLLVDFPPEKKKMSTKFHLKCVYFAKCVRVCVCVSATN